MLSFLVTRCSFVPATNSSHTEHQHDVLRRAIDKLLPLPAAQPPAATTAAADRAPAQQAARRRTQLWADIVQQAAAAKLHKYVLVAAPWVAAQQWQPGSDREMLLLQVRPGCSAAHCCLRALAKTR
jgi:hypothetical protein